MRYVFFVFFFFQAEDGIRDHCVTGVQTCALPISWETAEDLEEEVVDGGAQVVEMPAPVRADGDAEIESLLERSHWLLAKMHAEDREEAIDLHEKIDTAAASGDVAALKEASGALKE